MARLSISDAARVTGVSRMLLYRYIKAGKLSRTPDGTLDTVELLRAGLVLQTSDVTPSVTSLHNVTPEPVPSVTSTVTTDVTPVVTALERLVEVLQRELDAARSREQTHREELTWLRRHFDQVQQRYDRLLDTPRPPVAPVDEPHVPPRPMTAQTHSTAAVVDLTTHMPAYNPDTHTLGALCKRGHDWQGTGQSLRKRSNHRCLACDAEQSRQRRRLGEG